MEAINMLSTMFFCLSLALLANSSGTDNQFVTVCYGELGCFDTGPPFFDASERPESLPPVSPSEADTKFKLFTPENKHKAYHLELNDDSFRESGFDAKLPLKILIFGYEDILVPGDDFSRMKNALLERGQCNVIIVDWSKSNHGEYPQAVANARVVGAMTAQLLNFLTEVTSGNVSASRVHIIGHSLGAQVAGYAGKRVENIQRITGLDPAGPYFTGTANVVHLEANDAKFVDVMHTNMGNDQKSAYGTTDVIGHMDFYPNGGARQPACHSKLLTLLEDNKDLERSCDHDIARKYFIASIKDSGGCTFIGTDCNSYDDYKTGACRSNQKAIMGYDSIPIPGVNKGSKFYLNTSSKYPYCLS